MARGSKFTPEFKLEVARASLARTGSRAMVAKKFRVSLPTVYKWENEYNGQI